MAGMEDEEDRVEERRQLVRERKEGKARMRTLRFEQLLDILAHGNSEESRAAAITIGERGDERALPVLLDVLERTDDSNLRNGVAVGLHELADPRALGPLLRVMRDIKRADGDYDTLVWALGAMDARSAVVDLARIVCEGYFVAALMAMGVIEGFQGPVEETDRDEAIWILRRGAVEGELDDDRREMVAHVLELLETDGAED